MEKYGPGRIWSGMKSGCRSIAGFALDQNMESDWNIVWEEKGIFNTILISDWISFFSLCGLQIYAIVEGAFDYRDTLFLVIFGLNLIVTVTAERALKLYYNMKILALIVQGTTFYGALFVFWVDLQKLVQPYNFSDRNPYPYLYTEAECLVNIWVGLNCLAMLLLSICTLTKPLEVPPTEENNQPTRRSKRTKQTYRFRFLPVFGSFGRADPEEEGDEPSISTVPSTASTSQGSGIHLSEEIIVGFGSRAEQSQETDSLSSDGPAQDYVTDAEATILDIETFDPREPLEGTERAGPWRCACDQEESGWWGWRLGPKPDAGSGPISVADFDVVLHLTCDQINTIQVEGENAV